VLILHEQHRLRSSRKIRREDVVPLLIGLLIGPRQIDLEGRPDPDLRIHLDGATRLLHRAVSRRKTQARSASPFLRGEERLEDMRLDLVAHPLPRIADRQHHEPTGGDIRVQRTVVFVQVHVRGLDHDLPAPRHRIPLKETAVLEEKGVVVKIRNPPFLEIA
jgi:hypothetical protein